MRRAWVPLALIGGVVLVAGFLDRGPLSTVLGGIFHPREEERATDLASIGADEVGVRLEGRAASAEEGREESSEAPAVPAEVAGTAEKGGAVRGRVVRSAGGPPVEGARVVLRRPDSILAYLRGSAAGRSDLLEARTGKDGRFAFRDVLPAEGYVVRASLPGSAVVSRDDLDLRGRLTRDIGDLVLGPVGQVEGRLVDASGRPVADARVVVSWPVENELQIVLADPDTLEEIEREGRSGADGAFRVDGLEPGEKTVVLASASAGAHVLFDVSVVAGETTSLGDVRLTGEKALAGRIEWEDGAPVARARVFAAVMGNRVVRSAESAEDGAFRIEHLPEGLYRLGVLVPGIPARVTEEEHEAGEEGVVVRFARTGSLAGRVVQAGSGEPVRRFTVRVEETGGNLVERFVRQLFDRTVGAQPFRDPEGRFRIPHVFPGTVRLVVAADGFPQGQSEPIEVEAGAAVEEVRIALESGIGLRGVVRLPSGEPAAGAEVLAARHQDRPGEAAEESFDLGLPAASDAVADAEGRFLLPPQTPAVYTLIARVEDRLPATLRVDLTSPVEEEVVLRIPPSGGLEGTVVDEGGRPIPEGEVTIYWPNGTNRQVQADAAGRFEVPALPSGPCLVRWRSLREEGNWDQAEGEAARREVYERLRREGGEVVVSVDTRTRVVARAPRLVRWTGRVLGQGTERANGVYLQYGGRAGRWVSADREHRFEVAVEPGPYVVWAMDAAGTWQSDSLEVPPGSEFNRDVQP